MSEGTSSTTPASTVATSSLGLSTMGAGRIPHSDLDAAPRRKWKQPCALPLMSNGHLTTKPSGHRATPSVHPSGRHAAHVAPQWVQAGTQRTHREEPRCRTLRQKPPESTLTHGRYSPIPEPICSCYPTL